MTGQFEFHYAQLLESLGWTRIQVTSDKSDGDGGVDILAHRESGSGSTRWTPPRPRSSWTKIPEKATDRSPGYASEGAAAHSSRTPAQKARSCTGSGGSPARITKRVGSCRQRTTLELPGFRGDIKPVTGAECWPSQLRQL